MVDRHKDPLTKNPVPIIRQIGRADYESVYEAMRAFTDRRTTETPDEIWLVEHDPVFTLGLAADPAHVLDQHDIPIIKTDRGGEVTYHAPGQIVAYLLFDLRRQRQDGKKYVREFVHLIEQAVIDTLSRYGVLGKRQTGAPGIYITEHPEQHLNGAKIAALGLKVRTNGCTYHGVSLNIDMDLAPFGWINPCGFKNLPVVDLRKLGANTTMEQVRQTLAEELQIKLAAA